MKIQGNTIRIERGDTLTRIARHIVRSENPSVAPNPSKIRAKLRALVKTNGIGDQNRILNGRSLQMPHASGVKNTGTLVKSSPVPSESQILKALGPDSPSREAKITIGRAHVEPAGKPLGDVKRTVAPAAPKHKPIHIDESVLPDPNLRAEDVG